MTVRMPFPPFVTRAVIRIMLGGLVAAAAIAVAALVIERTQLGADLAASRARLRAEVEGDCRPRQPARSGRARGDARCRYTPPS